jgi:hypothetical protein
MPRPPKKKAKKNAENKDDFRFKNGRDSDLEAESSDEIKNLASIVKCSWRFLYGLWICTSISSSDILKIGTS